MLLSRLNLIAFAGLQMSVSGTRREALAAGAAAAGVAAALPLRAEAKSVWPSNKAPIITMFDGRGCSEHKNREYTGAKTGTMDDEMCIKVQFERLPADETYAFGVLKEVLSQLKK